MTLEDLNQEIDEESLNKHTDEIELNEKHPSLIYDTLSDVVFLLAVEPDDCFRFMSVNQAFLAITGLTREQVVGKRIEHVLPESVHALVISKYKEAINENKTVFWGQAPTFAAGERMGVVAVTPVWNAESVCTHLIGSVHDLTKIRQTTEALRIQREIIDNIAEGVALTSYNDALITYTNQRFDEMFGYDRGELIGKQISVLNDPDNPDSSNMVKDIKQNLKKNGEWHGEIRNVKKDGTPFWNYVCISAFVNSMNEISGIEIYEDITSRKQAKEALRESERRLIKAQEIAHVGDWEYGVEVSRFNGSDETFRIFGLDPAIDVDYKFVRDLIHPDDCDYYDENMGNWIKNKKAEPIEYRIIRPDGAIRHIYIAGNVACDSNGKVVKLFGTVLDITERKKAEESLEQVAQEWQTTFNSTNDAIFLLDQDQRIIRYNKTMEWLFQRSNSELNGKYCWEIVHGTTQPHPECPTMLARQSLRRETMDLQIGKGWFQVTVDPILDNTGGFSGAVHVISDITDRHQAEAELQKLNDELEQRVTERTAELEEKNEELEELNKLFLGREVRMAELKKQIAKLEKKAELYKKRGG